MSRIVIQGYEQYPQFFIRSLEVPAGEPPRTLSVWDNIELCIKYVLETHPTWRVVATEIFDSQVTTVEFICSGTKIAELMRCCVRADQYAARLYCSCIKGRRSNRNSLYSGDPKKLLKEFKKYVREPGTFERAQSALLQATQRVGRETDTLGEQALDALKLNSSKTKEFVLANAAQYAKFAGGDLAEFEMKCALKVAWLQRVSMDSNIVVRYASTYDTVVVTPRGNPTNEQVKSYPVAEAPEEVLNKVRLLSIMPEAVVVDRVGVKLGMDVYMLFNQQEAA